MHEIVTVQLGQRANYIATHYWNTQESYHTYASSATSSVDHDISFRPGIGADGDETYMPRTVIYDLKGGFGSLKRISELYELEAESQGRGAVWSGPTTIRTAPPIQPSPYVASLSTTATSPYPTISTVKYWSDFSHLYYHPRSIIQLNDYTLGSSLQPFASYTSGDELFDSLDQEHDLLDRDLRLWVEECDQMQGVQIFTGADDAWGGFASRYVERLRDEYGKVGIWVWGLEESDKEGRKEEQLMRKANAARTLHDISTHASLYIPISKIPQNLPKYVSLDRTSAWHTSAVLMTAIESMTLPCRIRGEDEKRTAFHDFEAALNTNSNQHIAQLGLSVLSPMVGTTRGNKLATGDPRVLNARIAHVLLEEDGLGIDSDSTSKHDLELFPGLTSGTESDRVGPRKAAHTFGQVDSHRGVSVDDTARPVPEDDEYGRKRRRIGNMPLVKRYRSSLPFEILDTFPQVFYDLPVGDTLTVHSSLSTTTNVANRVKDLQRVVNRMVGLDEREALGNGLGEIAEAYEEGWDSGSDTDNDD